jgi:hypothetical protein
MPRFRPFPILFRLVQRLGLRVGQRLRQRVHLRLRQRLLRLCLRAKAGSCWLCRSWSRFYKTVSAEING